MRDTPAPEWLIKHPKIHAAAFIASIVASLFVGAKITNHNQLACINTTLGATTSPKDVTGNRLPVCQTISPPEEGGWETSRLRQTNKYWSPKDSFSAPVMWTKQGYSPNFSTLSIEYRIVSTKGHKGNNPPALIISLGEKDEAGQIKELASGWIPEGPNLQLMRIKDNGGENSYGLTSPVRTGTLNTIKLTKVNSNGDTITYNATYYYKSTLVDQGLSDDRQIMTKFSSPEIEKSDLKLYFGIGTYNGQQIKIEKMEVCYSPEK